MDIRLGDHGLKIVVEETAFEGVKRIADKVARDIEKVTDNRPEIVENIVADQSGTEVQILCATVGKSPLLQQLMEEGKIDLSGVVGKREVYKLELLQDAFEGIKQTLVICGSDKRGTIYGMFALSEYIGVSPLCFWGDVEPVKNVDIRIKSDIEVVSFEPSVKYRGFFINDEWPCCGNWAVEHFGGFNADMYEHVFELLLRMKGNYLWPAMWSASFPLDGPDSANEELADIYGVVMGYSHHEPCLRASEEWDKVRGEGSRYGNEWNFYTNEDGLLNYWEDALKRSGKYENIITIGMRGERDSSMLGDNATVAENVALLMDIIKKQRQLIRTHVNEDLEQVPQLLALYKEVEDYFYGNEAAQGLKDWKELEGVICMLCEDNFGHMRTLPTEEIRNRKGGFGMYYHMDYHGGPISYEWVDSTPFSKIWEQMCMAYEYGIRDVWIVNVGDLKFHEVPLTYFMSMAYDYDRWGTNNHNSYKEYVQHFVKKNFPEAGVLQKDIEQVLTQYIDSNHMRRPESLHAGIYHPCHYGETEDMLQKAEKLERLSQKVYEALNEREKNAYYSMIHFSAMASMNLLKMHLYAGKNAHYASQGKVVANEYAKKVELCILRDKKLAEDFASFLDGKWNSMQLAQHIGFTRWNEDGYQYPVTMHVEPIHKPQMLVSRKDDKKIVSKTYGAYETLEIADFQYEGCEDVVLEIANSGIGSFHYTIQVEGNVLPAWLEVTPMEGEVAVQEEVKISCKRELLTEDTQKVRLLISGGDTCVAIEITGVAKDYNQLPDKTFVSQENVVVMDAVHYCKKQDTAKGAYQVLEGYGTYKTAVKVFPEVASFHAEEEKPTLTYRFMLEQAGDYQVEIITAPTNPTKQGQSLHIVLDNHLDKAKEVQLISPSFKAGDTRNWEWCQGVLNQYRQTSVVLSFEKGVQELTIGAREAGVVLERIRIYPAKMKLKESYLGPRECYFHQKG